jgi:hypothetical protein
VFQVMFHLGDLSDGVVVGSAAVSRVAPHGARAARVKTVVAWLTKVLLQQARFLDGDCVPLGGYRVSRRVSG